MARFLTRPTLARRDAPFPKQGRSERLKMILPKLARVPCPWDGSDESPTARVVPIPDFISKGSLVDPRLRASNEHILIVRVPRAGGRLGCPSHPSEGARCASTGDSPDHPPSLLAGFFSILLYHKVH